MPKPRALTESEEASVLARYRAANGKRGTIAALAREERLNWTTIKAIVKRAEDRETEFSDSRESLKEGAQA